MSVQTFDEYSALGFLPPRIATALTDGLGLVGLLLAALVVYGNARPVAAP